MKVIFQKISNNHVRLRDDRIEGECLVMPEIGKNFFMIVPPRDKGDYRYVRTSDVTEIISSEEKTVTFKTKSGSVYSVTNRD